MFQLVAVFRSLLCYMIVDMVIETHGGHNGGCGAIMNEICSHCLLKVH